MNSPVDTQTLWYLSRGTGMVTLVLLTLTLLLGIAGMRPRGWLTMPRYVIAGLHRNLSLLLLIFVSVHIATAVVDPYAGLRLINAVIPFSSRYRPLWVGLGAIALDLLLAVVITSLARARFGLRTWRTVHWAVYVIWPVAVLHSVGSGSDIASGLVPALIAVCAALVLAAGGWRLLGATA
jgi:methionine sulfoxide reductase heme-binding subunit